MGVYKTLEKIVDIILLLGFVASIAINPSLQNLGYSFGALTIAYLFWKEGILASISYCDIVLCSKNKLETMAILKTFKENNVSLQKEKVEESKKPWGYAYFARANKDDLAILPPKWKEYTGQELTLDNLKG